MFGGAILVTNPNQLNVTDVLDWSGIGAYIDAAGAGAFTARIQVFTGLNSVLDSTLDVKSDDSGDPLFIGALSATSNISKVIFSLTKVTAGSPNDFILDKILFQNTS